MSEIDTYTSAWAALETCSGILVPGGFGERGIEGKIAAIRFARERKVRVCVLVFKQLFFCNPHG